MKKVSIGEAAEILGISKEAVYNRIRRNSLRTEEIDGVRYVLLEGAVSADEARGTKAKASPLRKALRKARASAAQLALKASSTISSKKSPS